MLELSFFAGLVWYTWILFIVYVGCMFFFLADENGVGFSVGISVLIIYSLYDVSFTFVGIIQAVLYFFTYLVIGLFWARFKWSRYVKVEKAKDFRTDWSKEDIIKDINAERNIDTIYYWVIAFPTSMVGFIMYDFVRDQITKLKTSFSKITEDIVKGG